ncbi:MAG TPA: hypothetical protein VM285_05250 [Polyangia bacterium]|nr:hypothetical protein [Polyangia bacterium]
MKEGIPIAKPSRVTLLAIAFTVTVHLALLVMAWTTPVPVRDPRGSYDYLSSAAFEVFGPVGVIYLYDFLWPGTGEAKTPPCGDPESALDGLGGIDRPWCRLP